MRHIHDIIDGERLDELENALNMGADPDDLNTESGEDMGGMTPLFFANAEQAKLLINAGANINHLDQNNENALFALHSLFMENREKKIEKIKLLLENNINIHQKNKQNENCLFNIGFEYDVEMLQLLEENGLDLFCINDRDENILFKVSDNQSLEVKKYLVNKGLDVHKENIYGENLIFKTESIETLQYYIDCGVNINKTDLSGNTVLITTNSQKVMNFLIKNNIDINIVSTSGHNALDNCTFFTDIVEALLDKNIAILHPPENYAGFSSAPLIEEKRLQYLKEKAENQKKEIEKSLVDEEKEDIMIKENKKRI